MDDRMIKLLRAWPDLPRWKKQQIIERVIFGLARGAGVVKGRDAALNGGARGPGGLRVLLALEVDDGAVVPGGSLGIPTVMCRGRQTRPGGVG